MITPAENLKAGNPELTEECTRYGLKRAAEIMAQHALREGEAQAALRKRYPHGLLLGEVQVAAICAEAYRAGLEAGSAPSEYYECGGCGHFHPFGWTGDCRDDTQRFTTDRLYELHGGDWREVDEETGEET